MKRKPTDYDILRQMQSLERRIKHFEATCEARAGRMFPIMRCAAKAELMPTFGRACRCIIRVIEEKR